MYFAALRELVGQAEETLELPAGVRTVEDFASYLQQARPILAGKLASVRIALDESFALSEDLLGSAETIALIPPVSGG